MNLFDNNTNAEMRSIVQDMVREASSGSHHDGQNPKDSRDSTVVDIRESEPLPAIQPGTRVKTAVALKSNDGELPAGTVATVTALMPNDQLTIRFDTGACWAVSTCLVEVIPCPYALGSHVRLKQAVNEQLPVGTVATVVGIAPGGHTNMVMARVPMGACWALAISIIEPASAASVLGATTLSAKRPWYRQPWFIALVTVLSLTAVGFGAWALYEQISDAGDSPYATGPPDYWEPQYEPNDHNGYRYKGENYATEERAAGTDKFPVAMSLVKEWPAGHSATNLPETPFHAEVYEGTKPQGSSSRMKVIRIITAKNGDKSLEVEKNFECVLCTDEIEPDANATFITACGHLQCCMGCTPHWKASCGDKCLVCNK